MITALAVVITTASLAIESAAGKGIERKGDVGELHEHQREQQRSRQQCSRTHARLGDPPTEPVRRRDDATRSPFERRVLQRGWLRLPVPPHLPRPE